MRSDIRERTFCWGVGWCSDRRSGSRIGSGRVMAAWKEPLKERACVTVFGKQRKENEESDPVETKSRHSCYAKFSLSATAAETETPLDTLHHTALFLSRRAEQKTDTDTQAGGSESRPVSS